MFITRRDLHTDTTLQTTLVPQQQMQPSCIPAVKATLTNNAGLSAAPAPAPDRSVEGAEGSVDAALSTASAAAAAARAVFIHVRTVRLRRTRGAATSGRHLLTNEITIILVK